MSPRGVAIAFVLTGLVVPLTTLDASSAAAAPASVPTTSYYENSASAKSLLAQGQAAGQAGMQGIVILDFGRPASNGTSDGTLDFAHNFVSFAAIRTGVENYVMGYYQDAPANTKLDVAVGTNDSCGLYQHCGSMVCGCPYEPSNYFTWGQELAYNVKQLGAWSAQTAASNRFTDTVHVVAGDDAEPAFDPGFDNTKYVMQGFSQAVGGSYPPMVDYGSAEPGFWSADQLLEVANGFAPNVAVPEIYNASQIAQWAALVAYAKARYGEVVTLFGVMTTTAGTEPAQNAAAQLLAAAAPVTGQGTISWVSRIGPS